jgi:hypothetical protein
VYDKKLIKVVSLIVTRIYYYEGDNLPAAVFYKKDEHLYAKYDISTSNSVGVN